MREFTPIADHAQGVVFQSVSGCRAHSGELHPRHMIVAFSRTRLLNSKYHQRQALIYRMASASALGAFR